MVKNKIKPLCIYEISAVQLQYIIEQLCHKKACTNEKVDHMEKNHITLSNKEGLKLDRVI